MVLLLTSMVHPVYAQGVNDREDAQSRQIEETVSVETQPEESKLKIEETQPEEVQTDEEETKQDELTSESEETGETESNPVNASEEEVNLESDSTEVSEDEVELETVDTHTSEEEAETDLANMSEERLAIEGVIPCDFEAERISDEMQASYLSMLSVEESEIPSRYSSVESGFTTSVRNQGNWGTCWAFAAVETAEAAYKMAYQKEIDLSETHLIEFTYNSELTGPDGGLEGDQVIVKKLNKVSIGGNNMFTTFAMARWTGLADETRDQSFVYPDVDTTKQTTNIAIDQNYAYTDALHLQNASWINIEDADSVKSAIMTYGSVCTYYMHDDACSTYGRTGYSGPTAYYNYRNGGTGHAIAIVGWDDGFDKNNFSYAKAYENEAYKEYLPQKNGAWLVKNSWGAEYGDDGYFWLSYEDASLSKTVHAFEFEPADNYDHIYQYDGAIGIKYLQDDEIKAAAVYTSRQTEWIEAVGVGVASAGTNVTVEVYGELADDMVPDSGVLLSTQSEYIPYQGYDTIKLDNPVFMSTGEKFAIVVHLTEGTINSRKSSAIFIDRTYDNGSSLSFIASTNPGETFLWEQGEWKDQVEQGTIRIKAYSSDTDFAEKTENIPITLDMVGEIPDQTYTGSPVEPVISIYDYNKKLVQDVDYSISYTENLAVRDKQDENAPKITITGMGAYTGTVEVSFTILPRELTGEMLQVDKCYYDGTNDLTRFISLYDSKNNRSPQQGTDYRISFDQAQAKIGENCFTVNGIGNYCGELQGSITMKKLDLSMAQVEIAEVGEYTGKQIKPVVRVLYQNNVIPTTEYTVTYGNNVHAGKEAYVMIKAKNKNCTGSRKDTFEISPKDISQGKTAGITYSFAKAVYNGKKWEPPITIRYDQIKLKKGRDFTAEYEGSVNATKESHVTINGTGDYCGTLTAGFEIQPRAVAADGLKVKMGRNRDVLQLDVTSGSYALTEQDYTVTFFKAGHTEAIESTKVEYGQRYDLEITLQGNFYTKNGNAIVKKGIVCVRNMQDLTVTLKDPAADFIYDGKNKKPEIVVMDSEGNIVDKKYYKVTYQNNKNAGTATIRVQGKGDYMGELTLPFTIKPQLIQELNISDIKEQTYSGKPLLPKVTVKNGARKLSAGQNKDYVISYENNVNVTYGEAGDSVIAGAKVQIVLSDNYQLAEGVTTQKTFCIMPAKITAIAVPKQYYTGSAVTPDSGDIKVKAGSLVLSTADFTLEATDNVAVSNKAVLVVKAVEKGNYTGELRKKFAIVKTPMKNLTFPSVQEGLEYWGSQVDLSECRPKDAAGNLVPNEQYTVKITGTNRPGKTISVTYKAKADSIYTGSVTKKYKIIQGNLSNILSVNENVKIVKTYSGEKLELTADEIKQLFVLQESEDEIQEYPEYEAKYSGQTDAGVARITLYGKGYYTGQITATFEIEPCRISKAVITTKSRTVPYLEGQDACLEIESVVVEGRTLTKGIDYTISYSNADQKGTACATVHGKGNYQGTRYLYYRIE